MKFRLKYIEGLGYYPQVKEGWFSGWQQIGKHTSGYGLYPNDHIDYPLPTRDRAVGRCMSFLTWHNASKNKPAYIPL